MCTAVTYKTKDFYMGRNLDYEFSYGEEVAVTPRNFSYDFRHDRNADSRYAIVGMAHIEDGYPLYYDAVNEQGVGMAGLNFAGNALYGRHNSEKRNVAQFEIIPWILSQCGNLEQVRGLLEDTNITDDAFSSSLPPSQLHWIIADETGAITLESTEKGLKVYENTAGVLTNNPPFDMQMMYLNNFMGLSPKQPDNRFSEDLELNHYSRGMGAMGLPGDLSSSSRFVKASFVRANSVSGSDEMSSVSQMFHILASVEQQKGCCEVSEGKYEYTIYSSCWNARRGIYYYTTYDRHMISAVNMHAEDLDGKEIVTYPLMEGDHILMQNL